MNPEAAAELQRATVEDLDDMYWVSDMMSVEMQHALEAEYARRGLAMPTEEERLHGRIMTRTDRVISAVRAFWNRLLDLRWRLP